MFIMLLLNRHFTCTLLTKRTPIADRYALKGRFFSLYAGIISHYETSNN
jgi:hypothetical protein